jgi:large subunit ribosomal protein L30
MVKELKVTLKKSSIGRPKKHQRTLVGLKLTKTHKTIRVKATPEVQGMLKAVAHLLEIQEID